MVEMHDTESSSSSTRRFTVDNPSPELVKALTAHLPLPPSTPTETWRVVRVRTVEVEVQLERTIQHGSQGTTEQPIVWAEESPGDPGPANGEGRRAGSGRPAATPVRRAPRP